jgi:SAM-dependent methyltransferase
VLLTPARLDQPELLDEHDAPGPDVERSLRDLRRFNRYFGGVATYRRLVEHFGGVRSVVDLGAGTADLLDSVPGDVLRIAIDFNITHLLYLRDGSHARRVVADAMKLPFRSASVDLVTSSHFFHHFSPDQNAAILRDSLRIARLGVAVTDTRRHYVPLLVVLALAALRIVGRITRVDAPGSIRRGYTIPEARQIAGATDASGIEMHHSFPFRFAMILRK